MKGRKSMSIMFCINARRNIGFFEKYVKWYCPWPREFLWTFNGTHFKVRHVFDDTAHFEKAKRFWSIIVHKRHLRKYLRSSNTTRKRQPNKQKVETSYEIMYAECMRCNHSRKKNRRSNFKSWSNDGNSSKHLNLRYRKREILKIEGCKSKTFSALMSYFLACYENIMFYAF